MRSAWCTHMLTTTVVVELPHFVVQPRYRYRGDKGATIWPQLESWTGMDDVTSAFLPAAQFAVGNTASCCVRGKGVLFLLSLHCVWVWVNEPILASVYLVWIRVCAYVYGGGPQVSRPPPRPTPTVVGTWTGLLRRALFLGQPPL